MSEILLVRWMIIPQEPPRPILHCRRCGGARNYRSSGRIRVNANGKRVDAWLIYRCTSCDGTWNRPILERRQVRSLDPVFLASLSANDAEVAAGVAFDADGLRRWASRLVEATEAVVARNVISASIARPRELRIRFSVPYPISFRLDRLLADELQLSRNRIHGLEKSKALVVVASNSARMLRKPVRDGMEVQLRLPVDGAEWIVRRAACDDAVWQ